MKRWINFDTLKKEWMQDPAFKKAYDDLEIEFQIAMELLKARSEAGLSQKEVAHKMGTTQSAVARLESGKYLPSVKTLYKYAQALGTHLHFKLEH